MGSEIPYTKSENMFLRFSIELHKGENEEYSEKNVSKAQFDTEVSGPAKEKLRNSRFFINRVHGSKRMFRVYSIIILRKNAAAKRTVLPKVVKQNDVSHYFWEN